MVMVIFIAVCLLFYLMNIVNGWDMLIVYLDRQEILTGETVYGRD